MSKKRNDLSKIALGNPNYQNLKDLNYKDAKVLAERLREQIIDAVFSNGGHLSSNLGSVELTMSLLRNFDPSKDDIIFDVGHQSYTYKILTGRDISKIRLYDGVAPFLDRDESVFDKVSTGHSSSSVSIAYGMEKAKRNAGNNDSKTIAVIGDGALESGLSFEALNCIGDDKSSNLIVVLNDNGMSISKATGALSKWSNHVRNSMFYGKGAEFFYEVLGKHVATRWFYLFAKFIKDSMKRLLVGLNMFENLGFYYIGPVDGNDLKKVDSAFKRAMLSKSGPVLIHLLTKKGKGYEQAENDPEGKWHGVIPLNETCSEKSYSDVLADCLDSVLFADADAFVVDPAMVYGSHLQKLFKKFPERTFDVGIAEEHAVTFSGGLALKGGHPIIIEYSTFLQRAFDELIEDMARQHCGGLCIVERCGLAGGDGASHHGIYDVAMVNAIPNSSVYMPCNERQLSDFIESFDFGKKELTFLRIPRGKVCIDDLQFSKPLYEQIEIKSIGSETLLLAVGPMGKDLLIDFKDKIDIGMLYNMLPGKDACSKLLNYKKVFIYDPYGIESGTSQKLSSCLFESGFKGQFQAFTLPNKFITFGQNNILLEKLQMDKLSVKNKIEALISND